jgi:hypothetical protein
VCIQITERAIRIIMGATNNDSCREFSKLLKILPLSAQYIYSVLMFVVNNRNLFLDNAELYTIKTRNSYNLHPTLSHLTKYQKGGLVTSFKTENYFYPCTLDSKALLCQHSYSCS